MGFSESEITFGRKQAALRIEVESEEPSKTKGRYETGVEKQIERDRTVRDLKETYGFSDAEAQSAAATAPDKNADEIAAAHRKVGT